jgi:hypothetical protein
MYRWRVQITSNDPQLLPYLLTSLQKSPHQVIEEDEHYYLVSPTFEAFESLSRYPELSMYADKLISRLNALLKLQFQTHSSITKINPTLYVDEAGLTHLVLMETLGITDEVRVYTGDSFFHDPAQSHAQANFLSQWIEESNSPLAEEALQYFSLPRNWHNLEKIFEIIAKDVGQKENSKTLPRGTFDTWTQGIAFGSKPPGRSFDFLQTAHSYHWSGLDARHSSVVSQKRTGVTPMSLQEATEYITNLLIKWLQTNPSLSI